MNNKYWEYNFYDSIFFSFPLISLYSPAYAEGSYDYGFTVEELKRELNVHADNLSDENYVSIGFPSSQNIDLKSFYEWYIHSSMFDKVSLNNVADPRSGVNANRLNAYKYENEVVDYFASLYGFEKNKFWGIVTYSGTDGNNHGIYFGRTYLSKKTNIKPILYVSADAHYSIKRVGDLQQIESKEIATDDMGCMKVSEFEKALDPSRPVLVVVTVGTTFKGAIDNQIAIK